MKKLSLFFLLAASLLSISTAAIAQNPNEATAKASDLMAQGRLKDAVAVLDKAVEKNKGSLAVYKMRALLKRMTGDFAGALADYSSAIDLKSDDGELYEQRAMLRLFARQDPSLILKDLDAAIANNRKIEKVYSMRGSIRLRTGDKDGAISDFETAIGLRPDFGAPYLGLAALYQINGDDVRAASVLENFIGVVENSGSETPAVKGEIVAANAPQTPDVSPDENFRVTEATVVIKGIEGGRTTSSSAPEEASAKIDKLEQKKNTAAAYAGLASIYQRRKDYEKALMLAEKALEIDPTDFSAHEARGKVRVDMADYEGAISDFVAAFKAVPQIPTMYLDRGVAKLLAGKEAAARADFDKYLELFPNGKPFLERRVEEAKRKVQK